MTDQTPPTPPGWYYAPGDPVGTQRYWDGELWQGDPVAPPVHQGVYGVTADSMGYRAPIDWGSRVGANLIDIALGLVAFVLVAIVVAALAAVSDPLGVIAGIVLGLPVLLGFLYLTYWLPGITGQTPGRRVMGYEVISDRDGSYIGGGAFLARQFVGGLINNVCYIDLLWPLWDNKNQRLADKIVNSVSVRCPKSKMFPIFPSGKPF